MQDREEIEAHTKIARKLRIEKRKLEDTQNERKQLFTRIGQESP
jgi:hypothetical protein